MEDLICNISVNTWKSWLLQPLILPDHYFGSGATKMDGKGYTVAYGDVSQYIPYT